MTYKLHGRMDWKWRIFSPDSGPSKNHYTVNFMNIVWLRRQSIIHDDSVGFTLISLFFDEKGDTKKLFQYTVDHWHQKEGR